ncbi:M15 family peptidase, partial [Amycolatopsis sp. H6(2020)]|nr:M15 family peptidase [Amycolatopsis sp. H6(2020)]
MKLRTRVLAIVTFTLSAAVAVAAPAPAATGVGSGSGIGTQTVELAAPAGSGLAPYIAVIKPVTAERLGNSWRAGCPVGPDQLRLINLSFLGFDGAVHRGELVVNADRALEVARVFGDLYFGRFPIERMET